MEAEHARFFSSKKRYLIHKCGLYKGFIIKIF